jgi:hypothetical protein
VLARLETEPGVESAEVDRRGELLHVRVGSATDVGRVIDRLHEMGFAGEVITDTEVHGQRWYGPQDVGELSREEAHVIARRVVPLFAEKAHIDAAEVGVLSDLAAAALHDCITARDPAARGPDSTLNSVCGRAVEEATRARIGPDRAAALGNAIEADLASRSAFKA